MSKTPEDFKILFSQLHEKMESVDPEDLKLVATTEFKEVAEALLHDFQSYQLRGVPHP